MSTTTKSKIKIPGYRILRELGHGGMAHVYLAIQESFGREVALKILSPHLAEDAQFSERFIREVRIISQLSHPNIVTVYDAGKHGKYHYMSMEYIPGKDLKQLKETTTRKNAIRIVKDIARALDFAGAKGFVHRDVKPENIMIHENDHRVILMDFGIAHCEDISQGMTQTGKALGTPHFMSPEQTKGLKVDPRSDIYSLGVVLYQVIAGYLPFDASSAVAVGIKHITAPIPLLPAGLEIFQPIVNTCLSKQAKHRYQKASDLIAALDKITDEQIDQIDTKAVLFRQAGANHDSETQISDAVETKIDSVPEIVFPSNTRNVTPPERFFSIETDNRRRNLLLILLISTLAWAGYKKQNEVVEYWGYTLLPKTAEIFPQLFPQSYLQYWANKSGLNKKTGASISDNAITSQQQNNTAVTENKIAIKVIPVVLTEEEKIIQLKANLPEKPENAVELASIYKDMLQQSKRDPVAIQGLKDLREWYQQQIKLTFEENDSAKARQLVDMMKTSFPNITKNKRFIRLENRVLQEERYTAHLISAQKYFNAGALSKPRGKNALFEINAVLSSAPKNKAAVDFYNKIVSSYIDKTSQLEQQGNLQNALFMIEEGIAALDNNKALLDKRSELKKLVQHNAHIKSLFKYANKLLLAGDYILPPERNAYDVYQDILKTEKNNLLAQAGLKKIHQGLSSKIISIIRDGRLSYAETYLNEAIKRYGKTSLLAKTQLKLNDALEALAPSIMLLKFNNSPLSTLAGKNKTSLQLDRMLYVGFKYINFKSATTLIQAILRDGSGQMVLAKKPVVVSNSNGEYFFSLSLTEKGFSEGRYKLDLSVNNKTLISKTFSVKAVP